MHYLLLAFIVSLAIQLIMFIPAYLYRTDKLTDISYGLSFIALVLIFLRDYPLPKMILGAMVVLWGLRLSAFLFIRINRMKRDKRFDGMRENLFRFLGFWLLQGISVFAIMICPLLFLNSSASSFSAIGILIWGLGLAIESIADYQKFTFSNDQRNKGKWIATGLWKFSRHPNYLGEIMCWIGIYIFSYPALSMANRLIGLISPLFITTLLLFVSGIPILEKKAKEKWGKDHRYLKYKKNTSVLIPYQGLILSIVVCLSAGFIGSLFTASSIGSWYSTINKPFFNPPSWIFGPVWTFLYILMGISVYLAIKKGADMKAVSIFGLQLALNTLWSILFFGLRNPLLAFAEIIILWIVIMVNIKAFYRYAKVSAYLLIPYILWVSFAAVLNLSIYLLNP
jgi:tryptophan-rich sensory protein